MSAEARVMVRMPNARGDGFRSLPATITLLGSQDSPRGVGIQMDGGGFYTEAFPGDAHELEPMNDEARIILATYALQGKWAELRTTR